MSVAASTSAPIRTSPAGTRRSGSRLTGTRPLLAVTFRQDIRNVAPWIVLISFLSASSILAYTWIFPDAQDRAQLSTALAGNPALSLIFGPARNLMTADGFNAWRAGQLGGLFAGLMAILAVVRNSRANEDSGQAELVASGVIARQSRLAVAILIAAIASIGLGVVCFLLTIACGGGVTSSLILSATFAASGLMFAGLAAIAAQIGSDARTANALAVATLGVCYVLRGYIDSSGAASWATWLTPFGWLEETRPGTGNNPWPLLLAVALAVVLVLAGFVLQTRRDFGQGLVATRPGPAQAGIVGNIWGFAFKMHRSGLISWLIAFAGLGLLFGSLASSIGDLVANNPAIAEILTSGATNNASLTFAFLVTILQILAIIAAVMGVQIVLRIYAEETDYRVEPLLATSLRRSTYLASNALIALAGTAAAMLITGAGLSLIAHARDGTVGIGDALLQSLATIPAVWLLVGLALAAVGAAPTVRVVAWLGIVATFVITMLGPTFNLPNWVLDISPLRHVPNVTVPSPDWGGLAWLAGIAVVFHVVGFVGFRRRDVL